MPKTLAMAPALSSVTAMGTPTQTRGFERPASIAAF